MKKTKKNEQNFVHLYGFINGVDIRTLEGEVVKKGIYGNPFINGKDKNTKLGKDTRVAVNLDVCTTEVWGDKPEERRRTFHDVVLFTSDADTIKKYTDFQRELEKYAALDDKKKESAKKPVLTISMDGHAVPDGRKGFKVVAHESSIDLGVPQEKKEVRNSMTLTGNIGSVQMYKDYAVLSVCHNFPERKDKDGNVIKQDPVWVDMRVSESRQKELFGQLKDGTLGKGSFIVIGGQIHNRNYDLKKDEAVEKRYEYTVDVTNCKAISAKAAVAETETEKVEIVEDKKPVENKNAGKGKNAAKTEVSEKKPKVVSARRSRNAKGVTAANKKNQGPKQGM